MSIIEDVREAVIAIPVGFVASYGDIGKRIGARPRQVGRAMSLLDDSGPASWSPGRRSQAAAGHGM